MWSGVGLVIVGGTVTDRCAYSIVKKDGFRKGLPQDTDFSPPSYAEVLVMEPSASTLYIAPQEEYFKETPRLSVDSAKSLADELNLKFAILELNNRKFKLNEQN